MKRSNKGVTVLEFALILPCLFLFIFGIMEFGYLFFVQHTLEMATREGARLALVGGTVDDGGGHQLDRANSIAKIIRDKVKVAVRPSDVSISIYPLNADYGAPKDSLSTLDAGLAGGYMRVRTRYTHRFMTPVLGNLIQTIQGQLVLQAQATYRNEMF